MFFNSVEVLSNTKVVALLFGEGRLAFFGNRVFKLYSFTNFPKVSSNGILLSQQCPFINSQFTRLEAFHSQGILLLVFQRFPATVSYCLTSVLLQILRLLLVFQGFPATVSHCLSSAFLQILRLLLVFQRFLATVTHCLSSALLQILSLLVPSRSLGLY